MIIVITGSRKGIGRYLTDYYLEKGNIVIGCSREKSDITNSQYIHYCIDVTDEEMVNSFAVDVRKKYGYIDVLINNAGSASMNHFFLTPASTAERLMKLNYLGVFNSCRAFSGLLKKSKHPRIVNFSTVAVPLNLEGEIAYVVSKSAVESFTRVLSKELAVFSITVNSIGPTPIATDLIAKVPKEKINKLIDSQAIKRMGELTDVSNVVDFFISENSDFISGQVIYLGGVN